MNLHGFGRRLTRVEMTGEACMAPVIDSARGFFPHMEPVRSGTDRFGPFELDARTGGLGRRGRKVRLRGRPIEIRLVLLERRGELVTRDELRARLWPADTFVDFEHGLNAVIKRLRDALGDSADAPRYIETVPRRGYRLIAAVERGEPVVSLEPKPGPAPGPASADLSTRGYRLVPMAAGMAVGLAAVLIAGYVLIRWRPAEAAGGPTPSAMQVQPVRLTFGPGLQTDVAFSPDGRRVAFAWDRDGNFDLFTQDVTGGEPVRITSSPANESQPAWSPDGQQLVFRSDEEGGGLFTLGVGGATVRRIAGMGFNPVWMPDGRDVAFSEGTRSLWKLYLVKADGGE